MQLNFPSGPLPATLYFTQVPEGKAVLQREPINTIPPDQLWGATPAMAITRHAEQ